MCNGYLTVGVADRVVSSRSTIRRNGVLAYVARRSVFAGVSQVADNRLVILVLPAAVGSGVGRNSVTVDDVLVIGCDHQVSLGNGYLTVGVADVVVGSRSTARNDGVLVYVARRSVLAGVNQTAYNRSTVGVLPAAIGSGVGRNSITVGDGLVLSRNGEECLSNSYLTVDEGDGIVSSRNTARSDRIVAYIAGRSVVASECKGTGQH